MHRLVDAKFHALKLAESSTNDKLFGLPAVIPVKEGALDRILAGVQQMKDHPGFTPEIGADMGVIGSLASGPDWATLAPELKVTILNGQIFVTWGWGGYTDYLDACELQVDRGTGWGPLVVDTPPNYIDTTAFPAALTQWKYRGIYNVDGQRKGNWSAIQTIVVGG
jgi:hypothetical protein